MKTRYLLFALIQVMIFSACDDDDKDISPSVVTIEDNFETSLHEWKGDFADYPTGAGDSVFYELNFGHTSLPEPLDVSKKGIMISGNNHSDDLFMFLKKKVTGLKPNQIYDAEFEIEFASDAASNQFGVGGSPGESVYMGIGVTTEEPIKVADNEGYYRMNIKKGNQASDGEELKVIGNVANGTDLNEYTLVERSGTFKGKADDKGEAWIIVGTDSGFEATTTLYYTRVKVTFTPVENF